MKNFIFIFLFVSCAAALVPETDNPDVKIQQAMQLIQNNRYPMAEKIIGEALSLYEVAGNKEGMAQAYLAYNDVYKSGTIKNSLKAADSLVKAADIHYEIEFYLSAALEFWSASYKYADAQQVDSGCRALANSEKALKLKAKAKDSKFFANSEGLLIRIQEQNKALACKK